MRKVLLLIVIQTLLVSSMCQQVADCSLANNAFLNWLNFVDSTVIKTTADTTTPFSVCNELWSTSGKVGTCCDASKITPLFQKRIQGAKERWGGYMSTLHRMRKNLDKFNKILGTDADTQLTAMRTDSRFNLMELTNVQIIKILDIVKSFESRLSEFKTEAKTCFAESVGFRAKVFCHGCWAFGGSNFVKNGDGTIAPNFKMTPNSCNNLVTKCGKAWKFFYDTLVAMNLVSQVAKKKFNLSTAPANDASTLSNKVTVTPVLLHAAFDRCQLTSFAVSNDCTATDIQNICAAHFSWAGNEKIAKEMKDDAAATVTTTRILQAASTDDSATVYDAAGADMTASISGPTADGTLATDKAGDAPSSFGIISTIASAFLVVLALFQF